MIYFFRPAKEPCFDCATINGEVLCTMNCGPVIRGRKSAQASYTRCITDGAPQENCLKYLLPKEK